MQLRCQHSVRLNDKMRYWAAVHPDGRCGKKSGSGGVKQLRNALQRAKTLAQLQAAVAEATEAPQVRSGEGSGEAVVGRGALPPDAGSLRRIEAAMAANAIDRSTELGSPGAPD